MTHLLAEPKASPLRGRFAVLNAGAFNQAHSYGDLRTGRSAGDFFLGRWKLDLGCRSWIGNAVILR